MRPVARLKGVSASSAWMVLPAGVRIAIRLESEVAPGDGVRINRTHASQAEGRRPMGRDGLIMEYRNEQVLPSQQSGSLQSRRMLCDSPIRLLRGTYAGKTPGALQKRGLCLSYMPPIIRAGKVDRGVAYPMPPLYLPWYLDGGFGRRAHGRGDVSSVVPFSVSSDSWRSS